MVDPYTLPEDLPAPVDDGAADHLAGAAVPAIGLAATDGERGGARGACRGARSSTPIRGPGARASRCWPMTGI